VTLELLLAEVVLLLLRMVLVMLMMSNSFVFAEFGATILKPNLPPTKCFHCLVVIATVRWRKYPRSKYQNI
jgi:hypothetical protein